MKLALFAGLILSASSVFASDVSILKKMTCQNSQIRVEIEATHTKGDRIALLEWTVFSGTQFVDNFMSPLHYSPGQYVDNSLQTFGGSTLGSDLWVEGDQAELTVKDQVYQLSCQ